MTGPRSLQARLALSLGIILTVLWMVAAWVTALMLRHEMDEVFDSSLQETAQRLLPLVVVEIVGRDEDGVTQRLGAARAHGELLTYIVRDAEGRILLQSHAADPAVFPPYDGVGFQQTATHRLYNEDALQGSIRLSVAEPLAQRDKVARESRMVLGMPILIGIPLTLVVIILAVRGSLTPLRRFRATLGLRSARDLSPVPLAGLPIEISPLAATLNGVLDRLKAAFDAERSFAASAAHELRTPLAGAIAQAQRLQSETTDPEAARRGAEIVEALKRLTRLSEKMLQLARAEGGRVRTGDPMDLRPVLALVVSDFARAGGGGRTRLAPDGGAVPSDLDPDIFAILCRNLIENAQRHGTADAEVSIRLTPDGVLTVTNSGPPIPPETLAQLTRSTERQPAVGRGNGLGLAIVQTIVERAGCRFDLECTPGDPGRITATLRGL